MTKIKVLEKWRDFVSIQFAVSRENNRNPFYREYQNDYCYGHFHSHIELYFITDGAMDITINGQTERLVKQQVGVSFSFDTHLYHTPEYSRSKVFIIPVRLLPEIEEITEKQRCEYPFIKDEPTVRKLEKLIDSYNRLDASELAKKGLLYLIMDVVLSAVSFRETEEFSTDLSRKILFYLQENFKEQISLYTLSRHLGYSYNYISHYFKNCFCINFNRYVNHLRLDYALRLLENRENSITYCAIESGFNSMRSFYRAFRAEYKMTPRQYLKEKKIE